jgi:SAM-dependent methyltransferase
MMYHAIPRRLPGFLRRYVLHFEAAIEEAVSQFAEGLAPAARVLDAGAGQGAYAHLFSRHRYLGVDLGIGDPQWNYARLDAIADLLRLPFPEGTFDGCLNVVTLEHLRDPAGALREIARTLRPQGRFLLVAPLDFEVHQAPYDYFRFTRYGLRYLLEKAGFAQIRILPVGGFFRLLARRLLNALQFFRGVWFLVAALFLVPPALLLPLLDSLDRDRNFTPGYICTAVKR